MKKYSKLLVLLMCLGLILGIVTGCGGGSTTDEVSSSKSENDIWVVGTSPDYPPFEFVDEDGKYAGFDIELAEKVAEKLGKELKIEALEFESLIEALKRGKIDAIISCMNPTPERLEEADFTQGYHEVEHGIVIKPDDDVKIEKLEDVFKYEFGVQTGTSMDDWATKMIEEGKIEEAQLKRYTAADSGVLDVKNGRISAFLADLPVTQENAKKYDLKVALKCNVAENANPSIVVEKGSDVLDELNKIIDEMKEDGTLEKLEEKWLKD